MPSFAIRTPHGNIAIGDGHPVFIVAEMSANHNQNFEKAVEIIRAAAKAGANAIKLQTYTADTMTINSNKKWFIAGGGDNPDSWQGQTLYNLYQKSYTPWEWHEKLQQIATELGLVFFSTPFDETAVDFLETLNVPLYKIASYEVTHIPLLKKVARTGKPVIMSVGFASVNEIELALSTLCGNGCKDMALLHCVTAYSATPEIENINLRTMNDLKNRFNVVDGFSDNNAGIEIPLQAAFSGASIIEKHIITSHSNQTTDSKFSIDPVEFKTFVDAVRRAEKIKGQVHYGPQSEKEKYNMRYRRSIFAIKNIEKGEEFTRSNVGIIRPAFGLEPKYYEKIIGKEATQNIEAGTPLDWDLILGGEIYEK